MKGAGMKGGMVLVLAIAVWATSGCFATTGQLNAVQEDVSLTRAEAATADSARAMQVVQLLSTLRALSDSVTTLSSRMTRLRAETLADMRAMRQQVDQMQEVSGQSEAKLRELRQQIDARIRQAEARQSPPPAAPAANSDTTQTATPAAPPDQGPDANDLYQIGRDQLTRGGNSAARSAFKDLLKRFPDSPLAADAQFYLAESLAAEGSNAAADTAYAGVVSRYADSPRAPTALYKRGVMAQGARRTTAAKRIYNELINKYPQSDEAELARERLRILG